MGQKANPYALRLGINRTWSNFWYSDKKNYANYMEIYILVEKIWREVVPSNIYEDIGVQVTMREIIISVRTTKPSLIIGVKGANINSIQEKILKKLNKRLSSFKNTHLKINIKIKEITPETSPAHICEQLSEALKAKKNVKNLTAYLARSAMQSGCLGLKIIVGGRINGIAIARSTMKKFGSVPLQTLTSNIYYSNKQVLTKSGCCGVKCVMAMVN